MKPFANKEEELMYELGRYKKAVADRDKVIEDLKADMEGMQQLHDIIAAYIILLAKGKEIKLDKKELTQLIKDASLYELSVTSEGDSIILKSAKVDEEKKEGF